METRMNQTGNGALASIATKGQAAFVGAAFGDALGWPQERSARPAKSDAASTTLRSWNRKSGGRFYPHEEKIHAGEYSDDTQLLLCTARSLAHGEQWWEYFAKCELPLWLLYERGGGGATKRAAEIWLNGQTPWVSRDRSDAARYFQAGGNGVAMRILPHALKHAEDNDFHVAATNIVLNGIVTHGHPRALVGALAYGYAAWYAFRLTKTLQYGGLIKELLDDSICWSAFPDVAVKSAEWVGRANQFFTEGFAKAWDVAVAETVKMLERCLRGLEKGALAVDKEVLQDIGCFDRQISGAGTIAATSSVFLASRYAADPISGVTEAAYSYGADTDTIASMTGGLLGAVLGDEWLRSSTEQIQDSAYLRSVAGNLATETPSNATNGTHNVGPADVDSMKSAVEHAKPDTRVSLPDGRTGRVRMAGSDLSRSNKYQIQLWSLVTDDGQSLYIKRIARKTGQATVTDSHSFRPVDVLKIGAKIPVSDMVAARLFYEKVLGVKATKESATFVNLGGVLALVCPSFGDQRPSVDNTRASIYVETSSLQAAYENAQRFGATGLTQIQRGHGRRFFSCQDPTGNIVEVFETK